MSSILRTQERARARADGEPFVVQCGNCRQRVRFHHLRAASPHCPRCGSTKFETAEPMNTVGKVKGERQPRALRFRISDLHPVPVVKERPGLLRRAGQAIARAFRRVTGRGR